MPQPFLIRKKQARTAKLFYFLAVVKSFVKMKDTIKTRPLDSPNWIISTFQEKDVVNKVFKYDRVIKGLCEEKRDLVFEYLTQKYITLKY